MQDRQPLLGLVMIVRDEAHGIRRTLDSLRSDIDHWTILDTGSTDGTQDIVREAMQDLPGELHEEPFVDFSASRNRALDLHGESTPFALMPDSDDYLVGPAGALRDFCRRHASAGEGAYLVALRRDTLSWGTLSYYLPLLLRTAARWRYRGRVHEFAGGPDGAPPAEVAVPLVELRQDPAERSADASQARWRRDLALLEADLAADPADERAAFYLGQTYECLGRLDEALAAYERRIAIPGYARDERVEAQIRRAGVLAALGRPWPEVQQAYLDAYQRDPRRAEPLYRIAAHYYDEQQHALSYLYASAAATLPRPRTAMFVCSDVYDWQAADTAAISAFYVAQETGSDAVRQAGRQLAEKAVRARPDDGRLRHNLSFYARSAGEVFPSFAPQQIPLQVEPPYAPLNPSVHFDGERWRCLVRAVNYRIDDGKYYGPGGEAIRTRNFLVELTDELAIERAVEVIDRAPVPRSDFPVHGFEDCRLFQIGGRLRATCTVCDFTPYGAREIALLTLHPDDYGVDDARVLRGPWSTHHQKNWMPVADEGRLRFVYSTIPEIILDAPSPGDALDGKKPLALSWPETQRCFDTGLLRGGSQGARTPAGWLFVVHTVAASGNDRTYLHRFVLMSRELRVTAMSEPFYLVRRGVEFCAGLAVDGSRVVLSFGVRDQEAWLATLRLSDVLAQLRPDPDLAVL